MEPVFVMVIFLWRIVSFFIGPATKNAIWPEILPVTMTFYDITHSLLIFQSYGYDIV